jgi:hypothetical protein
MALSLNLICDFVCNLIERLASVLYSVFDIAFSVIVMYSLGFAAYMLSISLTNAFVSFTFQSYFVTKRIASTLQLYLDHSHSSTEV